MVYFFFKAEDREQIGLYTKDFHLLQQGERFSSEKAGIL